VPGRKRHDQLAMNHRQRARRYDHAAIRSAGEGRDPRSISPPSRSPDGLPRIRVLTLEAITGIPREVLRPDIYPPDERARKRA